MNYRSDSRGPILDEGIYNMRVTRIMVNDRQYYNQSKGKQMHIHRIFFDTGDGMEYPAEYVIPSPTQDVFHEGETCCFRVTNANRREVEKCLPYAENNSNADDGVAFAPNVGGMSYNFAMAYAKDIAIAQIRMGHLSGDESDFDEQILSRAWKFHQWLLDPKDPKDSSTDVFEYPGNRTNALGI